MNNAIQPKGHAMKKVYIGIDAHKETNSMASAFAGREKPELIGKFSADLDRFLTGLRKFQKKHDLAKEDMMLCLRRGRRVLCWRVV
jgi:hypothetical protein